MAMTSTANPRAYQGHTLGEFANFHAFAVIKSDGSVVTWGDSASGGDSGAVASKLNGKIDVAQIFSTAYAFAALRKDGSVVTWGDKDWGGDSSNVASALNGKIDVTRIFSNSDGFAALRVIVDPSFKTVV